MKIQLVFFSRIMETFVRTGAIRRSFRREPTLHGIRDLIIRTAGLCTELECASPFSIPTDGRRLSSELTFAVLVQSTLGSRRGPHLEVCPGDVSVTMVVVVVSDGRAVVVGLTRQPRRRRRRVRRRGTSGRKHLGANFDQRTRRLFAQNHRHSGDASFRLSSYSTPRLPQSQWRREAYPHPMRVSEIAH